jgi:hypothetical protein
MKRAVEVHRDMGYTSTHSLVLDNKSGVANHFYYIIGWGYFEVTVDLSALRK